MNLLYINPATKAYVASSNAIATAVGYSGGIPNISERRSGSAARLVTLDREGRVLASLDVQEEVESLSAAGRWIAVLYPDRVTLFDQELREKGSLENASGVQAALVRGDGSAIIVAGGSATICQP